MPLGTFLNGGAAVQLRGLQWLTLSETGQVLAGTVVSDSGGGGSASWTAGGTVPCRVDPVGERRQGALIAGRIDERTTHILTVPTGTALTVANQFHVDGRGTFEVTALRDRTGEWARTFEAFQVS